MRKQYRSPLLALGAVGLLTATTPVFAQEAAQPPTTQGAEQMPHGFASLVNRVKAAVVNISTTELVTTADRNQLPEFQFPPGSPFGEMFRQFGVPNPHRGAPERRAVPDHELTALGSGFIVDPSGTIITNNHVVKNGTNIEVTLQDGTTLKAKVVGQDELTDLAVLKVSADHPLPYVQFGDSDALQVGDWVVSVGNPFGLGGSVTAGILSARGRNIHEGPYDDFLQIDAPINQGNSGGPTFNEQGQVIGINTAIFSPNGGGSVGIGFSIPSNLAKPVVAELEKSGKVVRGWLGVAVQAINPDMEDALGVKNTKGALVASVKPGGPADEAGLKPGDVITKFGDQSIDRVRDLTWGVAKTAPGKSVDIEFIRAGQQTARDVKVGTLRPEGTEQAANLSDGRPQLGLELKGITPDARQEYDLPRDAHGVLIVGVAPGSPAAHAGLRAGDVIEQVNHADVRSPRQIADEADKARQQGKKSIAMYINRNGQEEFVALAIPSSNHS